jgi:hypothetical protein
MDPSSGILMSSAHLGQELIALPPFTPRNYSTLPPHFLTVYSSAYVRLLISENLNELLLKFLNALAIPVKSTLHLFSLRGVKLFHQMLHLLVHLEAIDYGVSELGCPVDFNVDLLALSAPPRADQHLYHSALRRIVAFLD